MRRPIVARWTDWSGSGLEHLVLDEGAETITAHGVVLGGGDRLVAARYQIICDAGWRVRRCVVELIGDDQVLQLTSDGQGRWLDARANPLPELDEAMDVDLSISPFTNTLPIRRLEIQPGQSVEIAAAYIRVPELTVTRDPQRYTCIEWRARYRYESLDSDFVREIEVDQNGVVVTYPGLFRRVY